MTFYGVGIVFKKFMVSFSGTCRPSW